MAKYDVKKLILFFLWLPGSSNQKYEPIVGSTRIQKMLFLFEKEIVPELKKKGQAEYVSPKFIAYKFGPYSNDVSDNIRFLVSSSFVNSKPTRQKKSISEIAEEAEYDYDDIEFNIDSIEKDSIEKTTVEYSLSEKGKRFVNKKLNDLFNEEQIKLLIDFKKKINTLPLNAILQYVYNNYEDMTINSEIRDKVL